MRAIVALLVNNLSGIAIQLASVPIFLTAWGVQLYGEWLVLYTIPGYLALADLGVISVANNRIDALCARRRYAHASRIYFTATSLLLAFFAAATILLGGLAFVLQDELLDIFVTIAHDQIPVVTAVLFADALIGLFFNHHAALFRSVKRYDLMVYWQTTARLLSLGGLAIAALAGAGPLEAALAMLALRILAMAAMALHLTRLLNWMKWRWMKLSTSEAKKLLGLSSTFMVLPISNMLYLHVSTLIVGVYFGAAAVAGFSVLRTFTRLIPQFVGIAGRSVWSEAAQTNAHHDKVAMARLVRGVTWSTLGLSAGSVLAYIFVGQWFFEIWTQGNVPFDPNLFAAFVINAAFIAIYSSLEVFVLATNTHTNYALLFLASIIAQLFTAWVSLPIFEEVSFPLFGAIGSALICLMLCKILFIRNGEGKNFP